MGDGEAVGAVFFEKLHKKYVSDTKNEPARKRAEAAWIEEEPVLRTLLPSLSARIAPRHRIEEPLGVGGVGIVLKIFDSNLETYRALKLARPTAGRESFFADIISGE